MRRGSGKIRGIDMEGSLNLSLTMGTKIIANFQLF